MTESTIGFFILCLISITVSKATEQNYKVFCFYDAKSFYRQESGKVRLNTLEPALSHCTHLLYGYTGISSIDYKLLSLNHNLDFGEGTEYYNEVNRLKKSHPNLKVLLSIGGGADEDVPEKYLKLLENVESRTNFIASTLSTLKTHGFDGVNLGWQFPPNKGKKPHKSLSSIWHKIKKTVTGEKPVDKDHHMHKEQFAELVRSMKSIFSSENLMITASVLPNVKSSLFFDYSTLVYNLDYVILHAYDFYTPNRNEKEADYAHPLKFIEGRYPELNIDAVVSDWLNNAFPENKLILGIPTFGRAWTIKDDAEGLGKPPISVDGAAQQGPFTRTRGLLGYYEICNNIIIDQPNNERFLKNNYDPESKCGPYAYRPSTDRVEYSNREWISYENKEDIIHKIDYVKEKRLAGVAIVDLSLDDPNGVCLDGKFPLLKTAASNLKF